MKYNFVDNAIKECEHLSRNTSGCVKGMENICTIWNCFCEDCPDCAVKRLAEEQEAYEELEDKINACLNVLAIEFPIDITKIAKMKDKELGNAELLAKKIYKVLKDS